MASVGGFARRWRLAFVIARRELVAQRMRAGLCVILIALPVTIGVIISLLQHNSRDSGERLARVTMGAADGLMEVTRFAKVEVSYGDASIQAEPGLFSVDPTGIRRPVRRDPVSVQLDAILPSGSRLSPAPETGSVVLATGGTAQAIALDLSDPMTTGLVDLESGRSPRASDEVAITRPMAAELGLIDSQGDLRSDAEMALSSGRRLRVVGITKDAKQAGIGTPRRWPLRPRAVWCRLGVGAGAHTL
ncbi:MAG: hypothetical protein ACRCYU_15335 [Nocardioides sp.]